MAPQTTPKTTRQLRPGDRVWLPFLGGHTRTVATVEPSGFRNGHGVPILTVRYDPAGVDPDGPFSEGNTSVESASWAVIV